MSSTPTRAPLDESVAGEEYLPIEEVATRLDLPLGLLIRRVEAGDVPARRSENADGAAQYSVRLSDLGFDAATGQLATKGGARGGESTGVELMGSPVTGSAWPDKVVPAPSEELAAVSGVPTHEHDGPPRAEQAATTAPPAPAPALNGGGPQPAVAPRSSAPPREVGLISGTPRGEVANMALDPRELVAGLLDRWERTLEQRIYTEQRQRFETELNSRQNLLKQLQLELQTARAEHAAAQADKDRRLAERERQVADLQRELSTKGEVAGRKRGWFNRG